MDESTQAIVEELEREIDSRTAGERLPSEHDLTRRFGVTRSTVRRAIDSLEARYLVRRVQGAGTFVNRRIDYVLSPSRTPSLHETVTAAGSTARTFLVETREQQAPDEVADRLGLDGPRRCCVEMERIGYIDDDAATYAQEWLVPGVLDEPAARVRAVESLAVALRDAGHEPIRVWSRASSGFMPARVAERLQSAPSTPAWRLESLTRNRADGRQLLFSRSWLRQDRVRVVLEFEHPVPVGD